MILPEAHVSSLFERLTLLSGRSLDIERALEDLNPRHPVLETDVLPLN